jgi:Uri superfamily endonuclease
MGLRDARTVTNDAQPDDPCVANRAPGTYLLLLHLAQPRRLTIGRLGLVDFREGWYVYIGSALGGLGTRLRRHARREKRPHWHIDTLRAVTSLVAVAVRIGSERVECATARSVAAQSDATLPVPRFGSSDCRCRSHLVRFTSRPDLTVGPDWQVWAPAGDAYGLGPGVGGDSGVSSTGTG